MDIFGGVNNRMNMALGLIDAMDDGDQGLEHRTITQNLDLNAGEVFQLAGAMEITILFSVRAGVLSWDIDAGSTAMFCIDPISPGASYTTESKVSYMTPLPLPAAAWFFLSALGSLGWTRCKST